MARPIHDHVTALHVTNKNNTNRYTNRLCTSLLRYIHHTHVFKYHHRNIRHQLRFLVIILGINTNKRLLINNIGHLLLVPHNSHQHTSNRLTRVLNMRINMNRQVKSRHIKRLTLPNLMHHHTLNKLLNRNLTSLVNRSQHTTLASTLGRIICNVCYTIILVHNASHISHINRINSHLHRQNITNRFTNYTSRHLRLHK